MRESFLAPILATLLAGSAAAQHPVCGFNKQPEPNLVLAADTAGNLFIGDQPNRTIFKLTPAGTTTTFATGLGAFHDIAVDRNGYLFVAEADPPRILKVTATGAISTFAGSGTLGTDGDGGPATSASLCPPVKIAADASGNVFINFGVAGADSLDGDYRIRKISTDGVITTFAGGGRPVAPQRGGTTIADGELAISKPLLTTGFAAGDNRNNLFVVNGPVVRKIQPNGVITTVAGNGAIGSIGEGGPATAAQLNRPSHIAVDSTGNLSIVDGGLNNRIRRVNATGIITTIAGTGARGGGIAGTEGPAVSAELAFVTDISVDGTGNIFVAETHGVGIQAPWARRVRKINPEGLISTVYIKQ
jgi:hypothetical protein